MAINEYALNLGKDERAVVQPAPYLELHALNGAPELAGVPDVDTGLPPRSYLDQPEVRAALEYERLVRPLGELAVRGNLSVLDLGYNPLAVGTLRIHRMESIFAEVQCAFGETALADPRAKLIRRIKGHSSIISKLDRRAGEDAMRGDPMRPLCDIYGVRIIVPDYSPDGNAYTEENLWSMLGQMKEYLGLPDVAIDGEPALRSGGRVRGNAHSAPHYRDQKLVGTVLVNGAHAPFEVQLFTSTQYTQVYLPTEGPYRHNRRQGI